MAADLSRSGSNVRSILMESADSGYSFLAFLQGEKGTTVSRGEALRAPLIRLLHALYNRLPEPAARSPLHLLLHRTRRFDGVVVSASRCDYSGCSKRPISKAAASEEARRTGFRYVESLSDGRTKLAEFFNILLRARRSTVRDLFNQAAPPILEMLVSGRRVSPHFFTRDHRPILIPAAARTVIRDDISSLAG